MEELERIRTLIRFYKNCLLLKDPLHLASSPLTHVSPLYKYNYYITKDLFSISEFLSLYKYKLALVSNTKLVHQLYLNPTMPYSITILSH